MPFTPKPYIIHYDGTVTWRGGVDAGQPVCCTSCGLPVLALNAERRRMHIDCVGGMNHLATRWHPVDWKMNDLGPCRLDGEG